MLHQRLQMLYGRAAEASEILATVEVLFQPAAERVPTLARCASGNSYITIKD